MGKVLVIITFCLRGALMCGLRYHLGLGRVLLGTLGLGGDGVVGLGRRLGLDGVLLWGGGM